MRIESITRVDAALMEALTRLLPQLKASPVQPTREALRAMLASPGITLLAARSDEGVITGLLTLVCYRVPSGLRARIEDLVVDANARGQGIGAALTRAALQRARRAGADGVALTSNPRRVAANALYQKLGFTRWETNVYFYKFEHDQP